jgi:hypothetical protein
VGFGGQYVPAAAYTDIWDRIIGAFRYKVEREIPNFRGNKHPANCNSSVQERWNHATSDVGAYITAQVSLGSKGDGIPHTNSLALVTYDDGSTEVWRVISPFDSFPLADIPEEGTLKCPASA